MVLHNEQEAIQQAIEGGYFGGWKEWYEFEDFHGKVRFKHNADEEDYLMFDEILADPLFWQDLGKARGWKDWMYCPICGNGSGRDCDESFIEEWQYHALKYFETRLTNGDMTKFWESLP